MSKHNYSQYSNNKKNTIDETMVEEATVVEETAVVEETPMVIEETPVETTPVVDTDSGKKRAKSSKPTTVTGTVVNCNKLNVRANPNATADVVCVLDVNDEVKVNVAKSTDEWVSVCIVTGIEGYCMRKFVEASL